MTRTAAQLLRERLSASKRTAATTGDQRTPINAEAELEGLLRRNVADVALGDEGAVEVDRRPAGKKRESGGVLDAGSEEGTRVR